MYDRSFVAEFVIGRHEGWTDAIPLIREDGTAYLDNASRFVMQVRDGPGSSPPILTLDTLNGTLVHTSGFVSVNRPYNAGDLLPLGTFTLDLLEINGSNRRLILDPDSRLTVRDQNTRP